MHPRRAGVTHAPPLIVLMGVSGSGKSTIGQRLAARLHVEFLEGDALHPGRNVRKMQAGHPLSDADRRPWLQAIARRLARARRRGRGLIVACSALKRRYRQSLRAAAPELVFVHLTGKRATLERRLGRRRGHFMPPALLASQLATLEPLEPDERGVTCPIEGRQGAILARIVKDLRREG